MEVVLCTFTQPVMTLQHIRNTFCLKVMHNYNITESQNHRMVEAERDLWRSSGPTLLLKQGHLEPAAQDHVQTAFEYL